MLRLAGLRPALLALAILPLAAGACSGSGGADAGAAAMPEPLTPIPAPAGHVADLFLTTPGATWTRLRSTVGGPAIFLPQSFGALAANLVGLPITMAAEIDDGVPVLGAAVKDGKENAKFALAIHVKAGDRFVDQLTRGEAARFKATVDPATRISMLADKTAVGPEGGRIAFGVLGNYLIIGPTAADVFGVGPYVVRTLANTAPPKEEVALEIPEAALAGPILDQVKGIHAQDEGSVASVIPLGSVLDTVSTVLADAAHARLTLALDPAGIHGRVAVTPRPGGGPATKLVTELTVGDVKPLLDLPDSASVGLVWRESRAARGANAQGQAKALGKLLGKGTTADDEQAIAAALKLESEARGDWQAVGVTFNGSGPSAVVRAPVNDVDQMRKALKQLVELGSAPSIKARLEELGFRLSSEKAVVENLPGDVVRVRFARADKDGPEPKHEKQKADAPRKAEAPKKADAAAKKGAEPAPPPETPKAIDLLYLVDKDGLFAAAGYDPKDSLRALVKAQGGSTLASNAAMAGPLASVGNDAAFVLIADTVRISTMTEGKAAAAPAPLVIAAGRTTAPAELWARLDVPGPVVQQLVQDLARRFGSRPPAPAPAPATP